MTSDLDLQERRELCDRFLALGPDAPTLCEGWTTADLAAHLVVRERDPIGASGILISRFEDLTEKRMAGQLEKHGYEGTVERVRTGPPFGPMKFRPLGHATNLVEYFIHHEDVRRANGEGPRTDRPDLDDELWSFLGRMLGFMWRRNGPKGTHLVLARPGGEERTAGKGGEGVRITGRPTEIVLELNRKGVAEVAYSGDPDAVAKVKATSFSI